MSELHRRLLAALERPHRLGMIGGNLEDQLAHCASFSSVLAQVLGTDRSGLRALDLGTGGGLPGVALVATFPELSWSLLDQRSGRTGEVERAIASLGHTETALVVTGQAQEFAHNDDHRERYDVVVARSFGPSSLTAECAAGFLAVGGALIVSEPPATADEPHEQAMRWPTESLRVLGFDPAEPFEVAGENERRHRFVVITKKKGTPPQSPRLPARPNRGWPTT